MGKPNALRTEFDNELRSLNGLNAKDVQLAIEKVWFIDPDVLFDMDIPAKHIHLHPNMCIGSGTTVILNAESELIIL